MKYNSYILIFLFTYLTSCNGQNNDVESAIEIVTNAQDQIQSEQYRAKLKKIAQGDDLSRLYSMQIDSSNSESLILGKNKVIDICENLNQIINNQIAKLTQLHGTDVDGSLKNSFETKYVNQIFIKDKNATIIKSSIELALTQILTISQELELGISQNDLPLNSITFEKRDGKTWEQNMFQDMPAAALLPIIQNIKNYILLTQYKLLEQIIYKIE